MFSYLRNLQICYNSDTFTQQRAINPASVEFRPKAESQGIYLDFVMGNT